MENTEKTFEVVYDCRWSSAADEKFIEDFISVEDAVFGNGYSKELFKKKFLDNIYGESVVVVVYIDGKPEGARALWRNDISGKKSYQPGDTCVTEACRGKGIFSEMTKKSIAMLDEGDLIYNFPNQNSYPGYMKMGWTLVNEYGFVLFSGNKKYLKTHPQPMDKAYADWWLDGVTGLSYFKKGDKYYLVRKLRKMCYNIVAMVEKETALKFPKKKAGFCFYRSEKKTFYNKKMGLPLHVVSKTKDVEYIPVWKIDAI